MIDLIINAVCGMLLTGAAFLAVTVGAQRERRDSREGFFFLCGLFMIGAILEFARVLP